MTSVFQYNEVTDFLKEIDSWPHLALVAAIPSMWDAVDFLQGEIPEYPAPPEGALVVPDGISFMSDKQRRWFFWAVQNDQIPGWKWIIDLAPVQVPTPYVNRGETTPATVSHFVETGHGHAQKVGSGRTGLLGQSFSTDVEADDESVQGFVGTSDQKAPWVVGPDFPGEDNKYQAKIHADRWWQFVPEMESNIESAWAKFRETFEEKFQAAIELARRSS